MSAVHYENYTDGRAHLKDLLDAAGQGRVATVRRDAHLAAVVDAARLKRFLASIIPGVEVVHEDEGWSAFFPGLPVAADGATFEEAIDELIEALREYAQDWHQHLLHAPNHQNNWGLVQLITLSSDDELRAWVTGAYR